MPSLERWRETWRQLHGAADARLYDELIASYGERHRKYHTARHLDECFEKFNEARDSAEHPAEVELALWFHDAVYDTRREDNEEKSADWARAGALQAGVPADAAERVHALIMATRHQAVPSGADAELLVDVDLSILGAAPERFDEYERQIREEYAWVPGFVFRRKRAQILEGFLARSAIFSTAHFRSRYERQARENLLRSLRAHR
jgi:predicted metal-dependent HD superfamily phosphohydrolase